MNPFLPLNEYIPDGEPHVFGDRIYLFGSHDIANGTRYCEAGNYVSYSAPLNDLGDWRYEGEIYRNEDDPLCKEGFSDLYAPDVVKGNDGRYYLYYTIAGGVNATASGHNTPIRVAVCDTPAGRYRFHGFVRNEDGSPFLRYLPADPSVINDDGVIRMYYGWGLSMVAAGAHNGGREVKMPKNRFIKKMMLRAVENRLFGRTIKELKTYKDDVMGACHVILDDDMCTVRSEPKKIVESQFFSQGTSFEGHGFYEAASIRKINDRYYFIYSDEDSASLSYAISKYPDRGFEYGGVIVNNGDVGYHRRKKEDRLNQTGNNHGSLECVDGQWYIFYHRQTNHSTYSRQACAEKVFFDENGKISQVECTSCGLNEGYLKEGRYPAAIACNLSNSHMPHITNTISDEDIPYITQKDDEVYITNFKNGCFAVYKYFDLSGKYVLSVMIRSFADGSLFINDDAKIILTKDDEYKKYHVSMDLDGMTALKFHFKGEGSIDILSFEIEKEKETQ